MIDHVFKLHGIPLDVVSNLGPQFTARFWWAFCKLLGASVNLSSGFHPETHGQKERTNQSLENMLRCLATDNPTSWSCFLPWAEYAHNSWRNASTGLSPSEVQMDYQPPLSPDLEKDTKVLSTAHLIGRCRAVWRNVHALLSHASLGQKG